MRKIIPNITGNSSEQKFCERSLLFCNSRTLFTELLYLNTYYFLFKCIVYKDYDVVMLFQFSPDYTTFLTCYIFSSIYVGTYIITVGCQMLLLNTFGQPRRKIFKTHPMAIEGNIDTCESYIVITFYLSREYVLIMINYKIHNYKCIVSILIPIRNVSAAHTIIWTKIKYSVNLSDQSDRERSECNRLCNDA